MHAPKSSPVLAMFKPTMQSAYHTMQPMMLSG
jgi:hypothetical protein